MASDYSHMADASAYAIMEQYRKLREGTAIEKRMAKFNINAQYRKGNWKMDIEHHLYMLKRCGCNICREEYYKLEDRSRARHYYENPPMITTAGLISGIDMAKETKPVTPAPEPKNYAVKLLVDQLKTQQSNLNNKKAGIDTQKSIIKSANDMIKTYNKSKAEIEGKIKELSVALKKLGHKE